MVLDDGAALHESRRRWLDPLIEQVRPFVEDTLNIRQLRLGVHSRAVIDV